MTTDQHTACPEPSDLAAYIDGKVTAEERAAIQRHLADCDDCREVVAEAVRLRDQSKVLPFWKRPEVKAVGGGILALAASLIVVVQLRPDLNPFQQPAPLEELVAALGPQRAAAGRLSGGFAYAARVTTRGETEPAFRHDVRVLAAIARIRQDALSHAAPRQEHALGVAQLVMGEYDEAIASLRRSAEIQPDAETFNDLAAAYLERATVRGDAADFNAGLSAVDRALALSPQLREALFNRAHLLEGAGRTTEAARAWQEYIARDSGSPWTGDAPPSVH